MLNGTISGIPPVKFKSSNGVGFWDGVLRIKDAANDTRELVIKSPSGLAASRNLTFPVLAVNDTIAALLASQEFFNKTLNLSNNIITDTSAVSGEIMVHNGTKFVRLPAGTSVQFLRGDGIWATAPGQGGGEANTMTNIGTAGVGVYKQKTGMQFEMKKINGTSGVTVTDNTTDNQVDLAVDASGILLQNLGGTLTVAKGGTGATTLTGILKGNGTSAFTAVTAPTGTILGTTDTQVVTNKTYNTTDNTLTATSQATGDLLKNNGTKFVRMARGLAGQVLKVNAGGTDVEWGTDLTGGAGSGNTTTLSKNTTSVTVVSNAAEADLLNYSITGNTIGTNGILHLLVSGYYLNNSGGDETPQLRLKLGGTTLWQDSFGTITSASVRVPFRVELYIKNNNSASQQRINGHASLGHPTAATVGFSELDDDEVNADGPIQAESSIDTTTNKTIQFTVDHEDSHASISFVADIIFLELIAS
jgi:hypothetical protein